MADDFLYAGEDENNIPDDSTADEDDADAEDEAFFQAICLKMYCAELEVYRQARQHGLDGTHVPHFHQQCAST